jgi:hypothetical protein
MPARAVALAVEPVTVVGAGVGGDGGLGRGEVGKLLTIEHLPSQVRPDGLDLTVRPGCRSGSER